MSKERPRTNVSIRDSVLKKARSLMSLRDFDNFSEFLSTLIREEWERRKGPVEFGDSEEGVNSAEALNQRLADKIRSDVQSEPPLKASEVAGSNPRTAPKRGQSRQGSNPQNSPTGTDR